MGDDQRRALACLWQCLGRVSEFSFTASNGPGSATDWHGHGRGQVVAETAASQLLFEESAHFTHSDGRRVKMQNRYRWTLLQDSLKLEHLRRAVPVLLFELAPVTAHGFRQVTPHHCGRDTYTAELLLHRPDIELIWQIQGPHKNERLHYHYW
ncbi:DUF6314 family protein [Microbulbifer sp. 2201CG32-9]|uniref:DUF6314 family protein n=1 Tax=Microbulbifer sp. 2201CG32-9 TaxID=3232309 RepID=UPI00345B7D87